MPLIQTLFILYLRMFVFDQTFIRHRDSDIQNQSPHWKLSTASASEPSSIKLISSYFAHLEINWVTVIIKSGSLNYPSVFYLKQDLFQGDFSPGELSRRCQPEQPLWRSRETGGPGPWPHTSSPQESGEREIMRSSELHFSQYIAAQLHCVVHFLVYLWQKNCYVGVIVKEPSFILFCIRRSIMITLALLCGDNPPWIRVFVSAPCLTLFVFSALFSALLYSSFLLFFTLFVFSAFFLCSAMNKIPSSALRISGQ